MLMLILYTSTEKTFLLKSKSKSLQQEANSGLHQCLEGRITAFIFSHSTLPIYGHAAHLENYFVSASLADLNEKQLIEQACNLKMTSSISALPTLFLSQHFYHCLFLDSPKETRHESRSLANIISGLINTHPELKNWTCMVITQGASSWRNFYLNIKCEMLSVTSFTTALNLFS